MTKGKRKRKRPGGGGGSAAPDPEAILGELETRAGEIATVDPDGEGPIWGAIHKLLLKTAADHAEAGRVIATRDADALRRLIGALRGEEPEVVEEAPAPAAAPHDIPAETLKKAMRAFRKRLKLTRLDHESKLGVGPMTGGKKADFDAIMPPRDFPAEVWEALAAEGKLRPMGPGFYELTDKSDDH